MDKLKKGKEEIIPPDGIIYATKTVEFFEGDTVFDVLLREMRNASIHMEFVNTPAFNSMYIEGIANLYEFDCGDLSGWRYSVNGKVPNVGCSNYKVKDNDVIRWDYTVDFGKDL